MSKRKNEGRSSTYIRNIKRSRVESIGLKNKKVLGQKSAFVVLRPFLIYLLYVLRKDDLAYVIILILYKNPHKEYRINL